jgi:hypothetical protein
MRKLLVIIALSALINTPSVAGKLIVDALETHSTIIDLPSSETASIAFKRCGNCVTQYATATANTVYELQGRRVSLSELRAALAQKPAPLAVLYRVSDLTLVRISAY